MKLLDTNLNLGLVGVDPDEPMSWPIGLDAILRKALSASAPFLAIAKHYDVPYWTVLCYNDPQVAPVWRAAAVVEITDHLRSARWFNLQQVVAIVAHKLHKASSS